MKIAITTSVIIIIITVLVTFFVSACFSSGMEVFARATTKITGTGEYAI
jgi:hypothetical protein